MPPTMLSASLAVFEVNDRLEGRERKTATATARQNCALKMFNLIAVLVKFALLLLLRLLLGRILKSTKSLRFVL